MKTNPDTAAFPHSSEGDYGHGLTKRELFSAMAMQGLLTNDYYCAKARDGGGWHNIAEMASNLADALIAELSKESDKV